MFRLLKFNIFDRRKLWELILLVKTVFASAVTYRGGYSIEVWVGGAAGALKP